MRYTTLIDISDVPALYRNQNTRLLYLHMVLKSGYHDDDRDLLALSIRSLAYGCGLTVSATRNALRQLMAAGMVTKTDRGFIVKKWVKTQQITPRKQKNTVSSGDSDALAREYELQLEENRRKLAAAVEDMTADELLSWAKELEEGRSLTHRRAYLKANQTNIEWLRQKARTK